MKHETWHAEQPINHRRNHPMGPMGPPPNLWRWGRDRGTYTAGTANAAPVFELGRQISYFAAPVFVTERLAAILKIYKRLVRKTKNLLNIIQKAAENAKLKTSELPLTEQFFSVCFIATRRGRWLGDSKQLYRAVCALIRLLLTRSAISAVCDVWKRIFVRPCQRNDFILFVFYTHIRLRLNPWT